MRTSLLRQLLQAYADGDNKAFEKIALQLAASESDAGHTRVAEEIRAIMAQLRPAKKQNETLVDIAQPRAELAGLLEGGYCRERLSDLVASDEIRGILKRVIQENRSRNRLESWGVGASRKLLFFGPPGCGKTLTAKVLAGELGMPAMTIRFDGLFSRYLGATANQLKVIFDEMVRRPAVYLFDEFDAIGKFRGDAQEIGEIRRVVSSFLQLVDVDKSHSLIIAATNYSELLDHAIFRRFDYLIEFPQPTPEQILALFELRLASFDLNLQVLKKCARCATGFSFADVARTCDMAIKNMALENREELEPDDLLDAVKQQQNRVKRKTT